MLSHKPKEINLKYILPLSLIFLSIYLASAVMAYKLISIGPLLLPAPPFIFPLSYMISDIITEVYGYRIARNLIWLSLTIELFFALIITILLKMPTPPFWHFQADYNIVFSELLRFVISGIFAVLGGSFVNVYLISKWKIFLKGRYFGFRSIASSAIGEFVLVFIIVSFGYSSAVSLKQVGILFFSIYFLELFYAFVLAWPAWIIVGFLKVKEKLDVYDYKTNYNPFSLR